MTAALVEHLGGAAEPSDTSTRRASYEPKRKHALSRMPRWCRVAMTGWSFFMFGAATLMIGGLALPFMLLFRERFGDRREATYRLNALMRTFAGFLRDTGLISYWSPVLPAGYEGRGALVIANHPSLIDVVLILSSIPGLSCVAKARWAESWLMGPLIGRTEYVPGPGMSTDVGLEGEVAVVDRIEAKLRSGVPMVVFPEGTRSGVANLRKFGRGAVEAAIRAGVPILPLFIGLDERFLMKKQAFYDVPPQTPCYHFEWFEPIETEGKNLDSKRLTKELAARYEARLERFIRDNPTRVAELP